MTEKSLFLDVVSECVKQTGQFAVCISYSSQAEWEEMGLFTESLAFHFLGSCDWIPWLDLKEHPFIPYLSIHHAHELICVTEFAEKPVVFAADEFFVS